ncbi:MAG: hypothetical protein AAGC81_10495 [Pseudomonadota bacterium]
MLRLTILGFLISGLFLTQSLSFGGLNFSLIDLDDLLGIFKSETAPSSVEAAALPCGSADHPCEIGKRSYHITMPAGEGPFPVILFIHDFNSNGGEVVSGQLRETALRAGYALIAPNAAAVKINSGASQLRWLFEGRKGTIDDFQHLRSTITDASSHFPIDTSRMILAGENYGGAFAWNAACSSTKARYKFVATLNHQFGGFRSRNCGRYVPRFSLFFSVGYVRRDKRDPSALKLTDESLSAVKPEQRIESPTFSRLLSKAACKASTASSSQTINLQKWTDCAGGNRFGQATFFGEPTTPSEWLELVVSWFEEGR